MLQNLFERSFGSFFSFLLLYFLKTAYEFHATFPPKSYIIIDCLLRNSKHCIHLVLVPPDRTCNRMPCISLPKKVLYADRPVVWKILQRLGPLQTVKPLIIHTPWWTAHAMSFGFWEVGVKSGSGSFRYSY